MKSKIYQQLVKWKEEKQGKCAILIDGPRRLVKSLQRKITSHMF